MTTSFVIGPQPRLDTAFVPTDVLCSRAEMNTGNLVQAYAICRHLPDHTRVMDIGTLPEHMNSAGQIGVIQATSELTADFDPSAQAERFDRLEIKLVAIGMDVQSASKQTMPDLHPSAIEWVRHIVERAPSAAPNLAVRGNSTVQMLEHYGFTGNAEVVGCPSLFLNPNPHLGREIAKNLRVPRRIAVAAGHQDWQHLAHIEATLARLVTETDGSYIGQHGAEMMALTRGEAKDLDLDDLMRCRDYVCPDMDIDDFARWSRAHGNVFFNVSSWIEHCRRFDIVVGTRIRGTAIALQAGVPALCIAHDSRTLELCRTMKMPCVMADDLADGIRRDELLALANFDATEFDENRRMLCRRYTTFLKNNMLRPANWLEDLGNS